MSRRHIHQGRVIDVGVEDVVLPNGLRVILDVIRHPGAACVIPLDGDRVTLIRQWRHCAGGYLWEAPAGTLGVGETPEQCARRELVEEAGLLASELIHAGAIFTAPGFTDEKIHIYIARGCSPVPVARDEDEVIAEIAQFAYEDCLAMVDRGEVQDAKTIAGLMYARRYLS
jgi:ADP-ribose pyrophosphatase